MFQHHHECFPAERFMRMDPHKRTLSHKLFFDTELPATPSVNEHSVSSAHIQHYQVRSTTVFIVPQQLDGTYNRHTVDILVCCCSTSLRCYRVKSVRHTPQRCTLRLLLRVSTFLLKRLCSGNNIIKTHCAQLNPQRKRLTHAVYATAPDDHTEQLSLVGI